MGKVKVILVCIFLALLAHTIWQLAACEIAYYELKDDVKDIASLNSMRIGWAAPKSDDDLREDVISKARSHDIALTPGQITVQRSGTAETPLVYLEVDYSARVSVFPGYALKLHFRPTGGMRRYGGFKATGEPLSND